jgi:beta-phosphoglucomutase
MAVARMLCFCLPLRLVLSSMAIELEQFSGYIFDLDGVVVDTRPYHLLAWQRLATELGVEIDQDSNEILRRLNRMEGIEKIMEWGGHYASEAEKMFWADRKNNWYIDLIVKMSPQEVLPGVLDFLKKLKEKKRAVALVSSSSNARKVLLSTQLDPYFQAVIDGNIAKKRKPAPDCFLMAAQELRLSPAQCVVFEDAPTGVLAAKRGGFTTVAVGMHRDICQADYAMSGFDSMKPVFELATNLIQI